MTLLACPIIFCESNKLKIYKNKIIQNNDNNETNNSFQDAVARVEDLQESGRLTGVLDDRGKFIHITPEEYAAVAKFVRQRGRVSIADLAASSNTLVNMQPDNKSTHKKLMKEVAAC